MNQLDYHPTFPTPSQAAQAAAFYQPNTTTQALSQASTSSPFTGQQTQHGGQQDQHSQQLYGNAIGGRSGIATGTLQGQQLFQGQGQGQGQSLQQAQQQRSTLGTDGMYNASPVQSVGPYSSAAFSPSISAGAVSAAQQQAALRHSASPHQPGSPFSATTPQQQQQQIKYPMAAPPLPHTPQQLGTSTPSTPQSPATQSLEQHRIKALLELNIELIQEISSLQTQGKGGATNPQHQAQLKAANMDDKMATDEYIQTMRRVQANLAYLAPRGNITQSNAKTPPGPAHMTPPAHMPQLQSRYDKLRDLFPGWAGLDGAQAQQQRPGSLNGAPA